VWGPAAALAAASVAGLEGLEEVVVEVAAGPGELEWVVVAEVGWQVPGIGLAAFAGWHAVAGLVAGPVGAAVSSTTAAAGLHAGPSCVAGVDTVAVADKSAVVGESYVGFVA